jgi:hypothetical protein
MAAAGRRKRVLVVALNNFHQRAQHVLHPFAADGRDKIGARRGALQRAAAFFLRASASSVSIWLSAKTSGFSPSP